MLAFDTTGVIGISWPQSRMWLEIKKTTFPLILFNFFFIFLDSFNMLILKIIFKK